MCEQGDLIDQVDLGADEITIHADLSRLLDSGGGVVRHVVPARLRRRGVERRLVLLDEHGASGSRADPTLVKSVALGRKWFEEFVSGRAGSIAEIAREEVVSTRYVSQLIPLAFLAPDIVAKIVSGAQPVELTTESLTKRIDLPPAWAEQRSLLGFD